VADEGGLLEMEVLDQRREVVGQGVVVEAAAAIVRTAVASPVWATQRTPWSSRYAIWYCHTSELSDQLGTKTAGGPVPQSR